MMDRARYLALVERLPLKVPRDFEGSIRLLDGDIVEVILTVGRGWPVERFYGFRITGEALATAQLDLFRLCLEKATRALLAESGYRVEEAA